MVELYFAKLNDRAKIPTKSDENAGYDVYANFDDDYIVIESHETKMIPTGIASVISQEYYFQLFERGSTGTKGIGQRCGVIDSSYRGEWFIPITNHNPKWLVIFKKEVESKFRDNIYLKYPYEKALSQAVLLPVPKTIIKEISAEELKNFGTNRGAGMLGSSGK